MKYYKLENDWYFVKRNHDNFVILSKEKLNKLETKEFI
jgi:hypothetical protein